jgi:hypothetical protein
LLKNFLFNFFKAILNFLRIIKFCPQVFPQNFCGFFGSTKLLIFFYNSFATVFVVLFVCFFLYFFLLVALAHGTWGRWPLGAELRVGTTCCKREWGRAGITKRESNRSEIDRTRHFCRAPAKLSWFISERPKRQTKPLW